MLPVMIDAASRQGGHQIAIAAAPSQDLDFYKDFCSGSDVRIVENDTYALLHYSVAALVTSGTATLEAALLRVPQVVCYKGSALSYAIARLLVKVPYISLVNLIMDRPLVEEVIQGDLKAESLARSLDQLIHQPEKRQELLQGYGELYRKLGGVGASEKTARHMLKTLRESSVHESPLS